MTLNSKNSKNYSINKVLWAGSLIIITLSVISVYNFTQNSKLIKAIIGYKVNLESEKQIALYNRTEFIKLFSQSILSSGIELKNIIVINESGVKVSLKSLMDNNPKIVLRYSEINCMTCVDSSLNFIEKYKNIIGSENVIVLAAYKRQQDITTFKRISKIHFKIYNTGDNELELPLEKDNIPFLFVMNRDLIAQSVFCPEKTMPEITEMYFKAIILRYFSNRN